MAWLTTLIIAEQAPAPRTLPCDVRGNGRRLPPSSSTCVHSAFPGGCLAPFLLLTEELGESPGVLIQLYRHFLALVLVVGHRQPLFTQSLCLHHDGRLRIVIG